MLFHDWAALKLTGPGLPLTTARVRRLVLGSSGGWCTVQAEKVRSVPPWSALLGKGSISPGRASSCAEVHHDGGREARGL